MKWEYAIKDTSIIIRQGIVSQLNRMGAEGWEMCGVFDSRIILKRPLVEAQQLSIQEVIANPDGPWDAFCHLLNEYVTPRGTIAMTEDQHVEFRHKVAELMASAPARAQVPFTGLRWQVIPADNPLDGPMAAFSRKAIAEAFVIGLREPEKWKLRDAYPALPPDQVPSHAPCDQEQHAEEERRRLDLAIARVKQAAEPADVARLETLFAKLRGMQYFVVDTSVQPDAHDWCRCSFRTRPAAQNWIDKATLCPAAFHILSAQEVFDILEGLQGVDEAVTG